MPKEEKKTIKGDIFQTVLMDEMARNVKELKDTIKDTIPEGIISSFIESINENPSEFRPREPWFSITVYNRGPNPVHVGVNVGHGGGIKIAPGNSLPIDLKAAKIKFVTLWCDAQKTSEVKLIAIK